MDAAQTGNVDIDTKATLIMVGGFAGSGKTHWADILLRQLLAAGKGACVFDKDTVERPLLEVGLEAVTGSKNDRESDTYMKLFRPAEYVGLLAAAMNNLVLGVNVVVSAPFTQEVINKEWLAKLAKDSQLFDFSVQWVWITCSEEVALTRLKARGAARDSWKLRHWDTYLKSLPWAYGSNPNWLVDGITVENNGYMPSVRDCKLPKELSQLLGL